MNKARAFLSASGASVALAALLIAGCAKPAATNTAVCSSGQTSCDNSCVDLASDAQHCGSCDKSCSSGQRCVASQCECAANFSLCGTTCVALASDHDHCGACGTTCSGTQVCSGSQCSSGCSTGLINCNGSCIDTTSTITNCGACGHTCTPGQVCTNSVCSCPAGQVLCNGSCAASCGGAGGTTGGSAGGATGGGTGGRGGTTGSAGGTTGSAGGFTGTVPAGWWTSGTWQGCAWTGIDTVTVAPNRTTITPMDFTTLAAGSPYHVSGSVGQDAPNGTAHPGYGGVALLGFNLAQSPAGASCVYNAAAASSMGPPGVTFPNYPAGGIAVNFSKTAATQTVRIQIQGPNGATDPNDRWCYGLTQVQGKDYAPFSRFFTQCYADDGTGKAIAGQSLGMPYTGQPISAIVFLVPGTSNANLPYDVTVNGFALGSSAADAPNGGTLGTLTGSIGGPDPSNGINIDFQRVKVAGANPAHSYIIQNDNWGNPTGTDQTLTYSNNSFKISSITGSDLGPGSVRSFPSIYVGSNGATMGGVFSTNADDHLPKLVSSITSANTTFTWSGGTAGGNYNATYDVWFAAQTPAATFPFYPEYQDGKSGFLMVWFYKPGANGPIGSINRTATIGGKVFNVYSGPRATGPSPNAPVVSYVAQTQINTWSFDLNAFIVDATTNAAKDANGGILKTWYLTDVFAGFEIWNGQNAVGLSVDTFSFDLKP